MNRNFMKIHFRLLALLIVVQLTADFSYSQTDISGGKIKGKWALSDSPFLIHGEVTIPNGETLEIEPGVSIVFEGHYKLNVQGRILAVGSREAMIKFTAQDTILGWHGLRFNETSPANDSSKIVYCQISHGKAVGESNIDRCGGAIFIRNFDKLIISHCSLMNNETDGDQFTGGGGIFIDNSSPNIEGNYLSNNKAIGGHGGGICIFYKESSPVVINNTITNNEAFGGGGIACYLCNPLMINNTIANNGFCDHGGGLDFIDSSPTFINTIIYGNMASTGSQIHVGTFNGPTSEPNFLYCNIENGKKSFARDHSPGGEFKGRYEHIIDLDPMFIEADMSNFRLSDSSPCIGKGVGSITIDNRIITAPSTDFDGKERPEPSESKPDIGAFENNLDNPGVLEK